MLAVGYAVNVASDEGARLRFGALLGKALADAGVSQYALEARTGVNQAHLSRLINGQRHPRRETVELLADALAPYLSRDQALLAAGYTPDDSLLRRWLALPRSLQERALESVHELLFEHQDSDDQGAGEGAHDVERDADRDGDSGPEAAGRR